MDNTLKKRITISISTDLYARLDKRNRSGDVENILTQHFQYANREKLYDWIKNRLLQDPEFNLTQSMTNGYQAVSPPVKDEELENKRQAYGEDGWQFKRDYSGQLLANKPPSREWVDAGMVNY